MSNVIFGVFQGSLTKSEFAAVNLGECVDAECPAVVSGAEDNIAELWGEVNVAVIRLLQAAASWCRCK